MALPEPVFTWRRLVAQGGLTRPAAAKRSCRRRMTEPCRTIRELHRLLGKKTLETEILKEALEDATSSKTAAAAAVAAEGRFPTKTVRRANRGLPVQSDWGPQNDRRRDRSATAAGR